MFKDAGRTKDEQRFLYMYNTLDTDKDLRKIARAERVAFAAEGRCVNSGETQTLIKPNFVSKKQVEALDCRKVRFLFANPEPLTLNPNTLGP